MKKRSSHCAGFSLVEVALAVGIAGILLVSLMGMLAVGLNTTKVSASETQATHLMNQVVDDLQAGVSLQANSTSTATINAIKSPFYQFTLPMTGSPASMFTGTGAPQTLFLTADGSATSQVGAAAGAGSIFKVTVGYSPPSATTLLPSTTVRILVSWPALADPAPNVWPTNTLTSHVETVFALNRS